MCCIKKITFDQSTPQRLHESWQMLLSEVLLLYQLDHPCIVDYLGCFAFPCDIHAYIVMEYAENGSLKNLISGRRGKLFKADVIFI